MNSMVASADICPRCRKNLAPAAAFCPRCGLARVVAPVMPSARTGVRPAPARGSKVAVLLGLLLFFGIVLAALAGLMGFFYLAEPAPQIAATPTSPNAVPTASIDGGANPGSATVIDGQGYSVGPSAWTIINVVAPPAPAGYRYRVALEGLDDFVARPDGNAHRQYQYPNPRGLSPYQLSGRCSVLWVKSTDGATHWVKVKYERVAN